MVIIVDDLDRCPAEKLMEVLQSLVLTEGTPFVFFLAIDQRVVVTAIENSGQGLYSEAGINGNEYLDKIVQIPFVIPQLADSEKANLILGYLRPVLAQKAGPAIERAFKNMTRDGDTLVWKHDSKHKRPPATGRIDESIWEVQTGHLNFPDGRRLNFWYYPSEGVLHFDSERGGNMWTADA